MRKLFGILVAALLGGSAFAAPVVNDLKVTAIPPWGLALDYTVAGVTAADTNLSLVVMATDGARIYTAYNFDAAYNLFDAAYNFVGVTHNFVGATNCVNGTHRVYWNLAADGLTAAVTNSTVKVSYLSRVALMTYCIIDLSGGATAAKYPISYLADVPKGGWTDEYKTSKIVLRRIDKPSGAYYAGVFEVTRAQWDRVMGGTRTSTKPRDTVSYNAIRGDAGTYDWPDSDAVDPTSFMGRLRQKTGLATLDLPSEEEWEYAARAGATTKWLCGDSETGLDGYAWYKTNSGNITHPVGTRRANAWGLYDVHGNAWEWCLDRYSSDDDKRAVRGGAYTCAASNCTFAHRANDIPSNGFGSGGFRLFLRSTDRRAGLRWQAIADGSKVSGGIPVGYAPHGTTNAVVTLDGKPLIQSSVAGVFVWQPQTLGKHTLAHSVGADTLTATYNVVGLDFWAQPAPNPPMAEDAAIAITSVTREIPQAGGGAAIVTSGSGTWTAAVSDGWISLNAASGAAGKPVAYVVGANADVEERVGYVYVAGHVHTVRQKGLGAAVDLTNVTVERDGGTGTVTVQPADTRSSWRARPNCDWISVSPTSGTGPAEVTYRVAPCHEVSMRSGTITVGDKVIYVTQRAYDLDISPKGDWVTGNAGAGEIGVSASIGDVWSAIVTEPWISIVTGYDAGTGSGTVRFTYTDNDTGRTRTGKIIVAGEVYTLTQTAAPTLPGIVGDSDAAVTGDAESGFVVTPSAGLETVEVSVPDGLDAAKVTVEVSPTVKTVKPHGATVKVVRDGRDITAYLDVPVSEGTQFIASATVKDEIVRETLDSTKGAVVDLGDASKPSLKTAPTKPGLAYTLREGATLDAMSDGDSTVGDGKAWTPALTVKGGASGFYSIRVSK